MKRSRLIYVTPAERRALLKSLRPECRFARVLARQKKMELVITEDGEFDGFEVLRIRVRKAPAAG